MTLHSLASFLTENCVTFSDPPPCSPFAYLPAASLLLAGSMTREVLVSSLHLPSQTRELLYSSHPVTLSLELFTKHRSCSRASSDLPGVGRQVLRCTGFAPCSRESRHTVRSQPSHPSHLIPQEKRSAFLPWILESESIHQSCTGSRHLCCQQALRLSL